MSQSLAARPSFLLSALACLALGASAFAMATPETSRLFVKHVDGKTRVVSYYLKPGMLAFNQQSLYFTAKSMTDDGRFLVFDIVGDEYADPSINESHRRKALVDFERDEAFVLDGTNGQIPWLDVERDQLWWVNEKGVHRRDLLVDPQKDVIVCPLPPELHCPGEPKSVRYGTHLTLSADRNLIFLDARLGQVEKEGVLDLRSGEWRQWWSADFWCNHGQFCPTDPRMAICAWEYAWLYRKCEVPESHRAGMKFRGSAPHVSDVRRADGFTYPRLWLFREGAAPEMIPSRITNSATHENFAEDGRGIYWCSGGVCYYDFATGRQRRINPCASSHASMSGDNRYIAFDSPWNGWGRGCGWTVGFWNRETHRAVYIHSRLKPYTTPDRPSRLHPDPHPQFVCRGRYVVCTASDDEHRMNLSVTPVAQLVALTTDPATVPTPRRFGTGWRAGMPTDAPYEMEIDARALGERKLVAAAGCSSRFDSYTSFALEAEVDGRTVPVPLEAVQGTNYQRTVVLRFTPPAGATSLTCVADPPGRFEYVDSETCDNLFDIRSRKGTCYVPQEAAGKPVKFELDLQNQSWASSWTGDIRLVQRDAAGCELGDLLVGRLAAQTLEPLKRGAFRETGALDPAARTVTLEVAGKNADGSPERLDRARLNLRVARVLTFSN